MDDVQISCCWRILYTQLVSHIRWHKTRDRSLAASALRCLLHVCWSVRFQRSVHVLLMSNGVITMATEYTGTLTYYVQPRYMWARQWLCGEMFSWTETHELWRWQSCACAPSTALCASLASSVLPVLSVTFNFPACLPAWQLLSVTECYM